MWSLATKIACGRFFSDSSSRAAASASARLKLPVRDFDLVDAGGLEPSRKPCEAVAIGRGAFEAGDVAEALVSAGDEKVARSAGRLRGCAW